MSFSLELCICIVANLSFVRNIFNQAFMVNKYSSSQGLNLETFSSGRMHLWANALAVFSSHVFLGGGNYYVDNLYINLLAQGGLIGSLFLIGLLFFRMYLNFQSLRCNKFRIHSNAVLKINVIASIFYIVMTIFEGYPPFGPGVASMFFWMLNGMMDWQKYLRKNRNVKAYENFIHDKLSRSLPC